MIISTYNQTVCLEKECPFRRVCANHETAGDFRDEGGLRPELFKTGADQVSCLTRERQIVSCDDRIFGCKEVPYGHEDLEQGSVSSLDDDKSNNSAQKIKKAISILSKVVLDIDPEQSRDC